MKEREWILGTVTAIAQDTCWRFSLGNGVTVVVPADEPVHGTQTMELVIRQTVSSKK